MHTKHKLLVHAALFLTLALIPCHAIGQNPAPSQSAPSSGSSTAQSNQAKDKDNSCTDNGTYVNSKGETVKRPETCSSAPKGATAQCRDKSYSFSHTRQGTCSHHGGVAKWL
jgi:resuscitation-promoting factor RpfB